MNVRHLLLVAALLGAAVPLFAQTKQQRVPTGMGQKASLFEERQSPATEKRIRESEELNLTQAEKIRLLEARVKELEAELAALKAERAAAVPSPSGSSASVPAP